MKDWLKVYTQKNPDGEAQEFMVIGEKGEQQYVYSFISSNSNEKLVFELNKGIEGFFDLE